MFAIRLLPKSELDPDGQRLGEIIVGEFRERFACYAQKDEIGSLESRWKDALQGLIAGAPVIALVHDPRFAWVVYREGSCCYVQQKLSLDGTFDDLLPRITVTSEGDRVSEWSTSLSAVEQFVGA